MVIKKGQLFCLIFSLLISMLIFEFGVRWVYRPSVLNLKEFIQVSENPNLLWEHKTNVHITVNTKINKIIFTITTDQHGFRRIADDISLEKPDGIKRILLLGDSVAEGHGVDDENIFSILLEESLKMTQVLNGSVGGYNTYQEVHYYQDKGILFEPDVVILNFCFNDVSHGQEVHHNFHTGQEMIVPQLFFPNLEEITQEHSVRSYESLKEWVYFNVFSYRLLSDRINNILIKLDLRRAPEKKEILTANVGFPVAENMKGPYYLESMENTTSQEFVWFMKNINMLKEAINKEDQRLIVLIYPLLIQVGNEGIKSDASLKMVEQISNENIEAYDLRTILNEKSDFIDATHLSQQGHKKVANFIANELFSKPWIHYNNKFSWIQAVSATLNDSPKNT